MYCIVLYHFYQPRVKKNNMHIKRSAPNLMDLLQWNTKKCMKNKSTAGLFTTGFDFVHNLLKKTYFTQISTL